MKALEKREYIIKKCYRLLLQKGYDGVSISDIQKESEVARGLLYHYFGSKEELFYEVISKVVLPQFYITIEDTNKMNLRELFKYIGCKYREIMFAEKLESVSLVNFDFLIYRAIQESVEVKKQYDKMKDQEKDAIKKAILQSTVNGELRQDVGNEELANYIVSLIDGIWINSLSHGHVEDYVKRFEDMFELNLKLLNHK